ncbi:hypothetical protein E4U43_008154 [Claviceps pusilla]|uniref:Uncharacterized protein n=1 Tax=Claviceps pusilla TaxID=123648 RepID=A0A9P7T0Z0_9HYPO|nr:hypothetical protein E4U43_008154 [Claviceps pusilla]
MTNFAWLTKIGATNEAVAVLNDQPNLFVNLLLVLAGLTGQCLLIWYIHFATLKPEQMKKKSDGKSSKAGLAGRR